MTVFAINKVKASRETRAYVDHQTKFYLLVFHFFTEKQSANKKNYKTLINMR